MTESRVPVPSAGLRRILYPRGNSQEVRALPKLVQQSMELLPVSTLKEALEIAWLPAEG